MSNNHWQETERKYSKNVYHWDYRFLILCQVYCWLTKVVGRLVSLNLLLVLTNNSEYSKIRNRGLKVAKQHKCRNCNIHLTSAPFFCEDQCAENNKRNRDKERHDKREETPARWNQRSSSHVQPSFNGQKRYNKQRGRPKYTPLTNPIVDTVLKILRINNLSLERYSRLGAAIKGLAIDRYKNHRSPVHSKEYETVFSETSSSKSSPKSVHLPSLLQERK